MDDREWSVFAVEAEASFRGDLDTDRELALREHIGDAPLSDARAAIARLVSQGHVMGPAPAELLAALLAVQREQRVSVRAANDGLAPGTSYGQCERDCPGTLVVMADDGRFPIELECDTCGEQLCARQGGQTDR